MRLGRARKGLVTTLSVPYFKLSIIQLFTACLTIPLHTLYCHENTVLRVAHSDIQTRKTLHRHFWLIYMYSFLVVSISSQPIQFTNVAAIAAKFQSSQLENWNHNHANNQSWTRMLRQYAFTGNFRHLYRPWQPCWWRTITLMTALWVSSNNSQNSKFDLFNVWGTKSKYENALPNNTRTVTIKHHFKVRGNNTRTDGATESEDCIISMAGHVSSFWYNRTTGWKLTTYFTE